MASKVLITGATRGLGRGLARYYGSAGWDVITFNRREDPSLAVELPRLKAFIGDVRDRDAVGRCIEALRAADSLPRLLFLNAGINRADHQAGLDLDAYHEVMQVNLDGVLHFIAAVLPLLSDKPTTFVASSSTSIIFPNPNNLGYYVSKVAEARLFKILDRRYRPMGHRFKTLVLGPLDTKLTAQGVLESRLQARLRGLLTANVDDAVARVARFVESRAQSLHYTKAAALVFSMASVAQALGVSPYKGATPENAIAGKSD
jgi:3-oxoacyl-[acyl-carrier protein] reductase